MAILFYLAAFDLVFALAMGALLFYADRQVHRLGKTAPWEGEDENDKPPSVSIIIPARNEARNIEEALQSVLRIDYPNLDLLVIDDRSTDETGAILDRMAQQYPQLRVVHLEHLPDGWLGKNYAMQFGADQSTSDYLLFTDADVVFQPLALRRAIAYAEHHGVDHLCMWPAMDVRSFALRCFVVTFTIIFNTYFQPWRAKNPRSRAHVGIGAFNLVRRAVYVEIEGHHPLAMRPDDDVKFGKLVKLRGFRQELVAGSDQISVEWYSSLGELIVGLEKNAFAGTDYSLFQVITGPLTAIALIVWPFAAAFVTGGPTQWLSAATAVIWLATAWAAARMIGQSGWCAWGLPFSILLFVYIQWRSTILTYVHGGIRWRDTHYPLQALRDNKL